MDATVGNSDACYIACVLLEHAIICLRPSAASNATDREAAFLHAVSNITTRLATDIGSAGSSSDAAAATFYAATQLMMSLSRVPPKDWAETAVDAFRETACRRMLTRITALALLFSEHYDPTDETLVTDSGVHYLHRRVASELREITAMLDEQVHKWELGARTSYFNRPLAKRKLVFAITAERLIPAWMGRDHFAQRMYAALSSRHASTVSAAAAAAAAATSTAALPSPSSSSESGRKRQRGQVDDESSLHATASPSPLELQLSPFDEERHAPAADNADRYEQEARSMSSVEILRGLNAVAPTIFSSAPIPASHAALVELDYARWEGYKREYKRQTGVDVIGEWTLRDEMRKRGA
jgi:hypothetical protein